MGRLGTRRLATTGLEDASQPPRDWTRDLARGESPGEPTHPNQGDAIA
jgi:hypothetical protein